ncbi:MAG: undecaprenyldiphospho-muramoylpentapeptide beta-N-acetylglucosaminyltransferase [Treponema sp.]|nr:undecaprenyldiphospho-muramoylpentapeptide beta-N-acetylglucosaminyltransferase [Treponema sp.]
MAKSEFCIAFTGGGTGGHIYPGLAVAAALKQELECRIFWIGSNNKLDASIVTEAGIDFFSIPAGKLRRNFSFRNIGDFFKVAAGFFAARKILKHENPALLFSKGGFVSVPPCAAAASLKIPVLTHESDYSPGLATRINARFAAKGTGHIITAYPETMQRFPEQIRDKVVVLGNPVRTVFKTADPAKGRTFLGAEEGDRILLVLGGSQGAQELNELVLGSLDELTQKYIVVHQTGAQKQHARSRACFSNEGNTACLPIDSSATKISSGGASWKHETIESQRYKPYPYIKEELPHVLAATELVLARSGAGTVWECATAGKPMVLLPLAGTGTRGDQVENARFFENAGAAIVLPPDKRTAADLKEVLQKLTDEKRETMAAASARVGSSDGTGNIVRLLIDTLKQKTNQTGGVK